MYQRYINVRSRQRSYDLHRFWRTSRESSLYRDLISETSGADFGEHVYANDRNFYLSLLFERIESKRDIRLISNKLDKSYLNSDHLSIIVRNIERGTRLSLVFLLSLRFFFLFFLLFVYLFTCTLRNNPYFRKNWNFLFELARANLPTKRVNLINFSRKIEGTSVTQKTRDDNKPDFREIPRFYYLPLYLRSRNNRESSVARFCIRLSFARFTYSKIFITVFMPFNFSLDFNNWFRVLSLIDSRSIRKIFAYFFVGNPFHRVKKWWFPLERDTDYAKAIRILSRAQPLLTGRSRNWNVFIEANKADRHVPK